MRVLVTRPEAQAAEWVARLAARGVSAEALPLIAIAPPADPQPVRAVWADLARQALLVFVSPSAVDQFFALRPAGAAWPAALRAGSPGPGTSAALRAAGVPAGAIVEPSPEAAQFDSESLWAVLAGQGPWTGAAVLIVRGGDGEPGGRGREWLAQTLAEAGARVDRVAAYRRVPPQFDAAQQRCWQRARAEPQAHLWLFSSSEAVDHLERLAAVEPGVAAWTAAQAVATHPRIAERARAAGFGRVVEAAPTVDAIVAAVRAVEPRR